MTAVQNQDSHHSKETSNLMNYLVRKKHNKGSKSPQGPHKLLKSLTNSDVTVSRVSKRSSKIPQVIQGTAVSYKQLKHFSCDLSSETFPE